MHAALTSCMALYTPSSSHVHLSTAPVGRIGWAAFACAVIDTTGCLTPPLFWYTGGAVMLALLLPRARSGQVTVKKIVRWGCQASHVNLKHPCCAAASAAERLCSGCTYVHLRTVVLTHNPPQDHLACGCVCLTSRRSAVQIRVFQNLVDELTAGLVGTGSAWKLYTCCAAATLVSGTRVAPGVHPGTPTGVFFFFVLDSQA